MDDDEAPPELVDVTALPEESQEEATDRVPITLVTGKGRPFSLRTCCLFLQLQVEAD